MNTQLHRMMKDESGITALETAIILIAFVVVAAIFAFTVLSTGTFLTERSKEAAYAGLQEVRGSVELKSSIVLETTGRSISFFLATAAGGSSADLSKFVIHYRTSSVNRALSWVDTVATDWGWTDDQSDNILAVGELARIIVQLPTTNVLGPNEVFALEIKPPTGGVLLLERTCPAQISQITDLH